MGKAVLRSTTPPTVNSIGVREFLRRGIYDLDKPTVVMKHTYEMGTWVPRVDGIATNFYSAVSSSALSPDASATLTGSVLAASSSFSTTESGRVDAAVQTLREYLSRQPEQADEKEEK